MDNSIGHDDPNNVDRAGNGLSRTYRRWLIATVVSLALATGCTSTASTSDPVPQVTADPGASTAGGCSPGTLRGPALKPDQVAGQIRVMAAASLTGAFDQLAQAFEHRYPGANVHVSYGASSDLVAQLHQGSPADVIATADPDTMDLALDPPDGSRPDVHTPITLTCNTMTVITAPGNPLGIESLKDLGRSDVRFVLCAPQVPCGRLGAQVLTRAGVAAQPVGFEANVKAVLAKVLTGEVDAGIVYVTDAAAARGKVGEVKIPPADNVTTTYPIAATRDTENSTGARAFLRFVTGPAGQEVLKRQGFGGR